MSKSITATPSATAAPPPEIGGPLAPGDDRVNGSGVARPNPNTCIDICLAAVPSMPSVPPCTGADVVLGSGGTNGGGRFVDGGGALGILLAQPLLDRQCVYAFDECADQTSTVSCAILTTPSPAPALAPRNLGIGAALLLLLGWLGIRRQRRIP